MADSKKPVKKETAKAAVITASSLREMKPAELIAQLTEKQSELLEKKRSLAANELANPRSITKLRREIALMKTIQNEPRGEKEEA